MHGRLLRKAIIAHSPWCPPGARSRGGHCALCPAVSFYQLSATQPAPSQLCGLTEGDLWPPWRRARVSTPVSECQLTARTGAPDHTTVQVTTNKTLSHELFKQLGKKISLCLMPATWGSIFSFFTWIWPTACFFGKLGTHRVYTRCPLSCSPQRCPQSAQTGGECLTRGDLSVKSQYICF